MQAQILEKISAIDVRTARMEEHITLIQDEHKEHRRRITALEKMVFKAVGGACVVFAIITFLLDKLV